MVLTLLLAHLWGVLQLTLLGGFGRTVAIRTVFVVVSAGLYGVTPVTGACQWAWTRFVAESANVSLAEAVELASYTFDPFLEETLKLLPLAIALAITRFRQICSVTDCVLFGAASGAGFGLMEDLLRHSQTVYLRTADIPSVSTVLLSWLPASTGYRELNLHLVWSSVGGLALGLVVLEQSRVNRIIAASLLAYIVGDHMAFNTQFQHAFRLSSFLAVPFEILRPLLSIFPLMALGMALHLDIAAGRSNFSSNPLFHGARYRFNRSSVGHLLSTIIPNVRATLANAHNQIVSLPSEYLQVKTWLLREVRRPIVLVWVVLTAPALLWFVIGGIPTLSWTQALFMTKVGWPLLVLAFLMSVCWLSWRLYVVIQSLRLPGVTLSAHIVAELSLRTLAGSGALAFSVYAFILVVDNTQPEAGLFESRHLLEALGVTLLVVLVVVVIAAVILFPPSAAVAGVAISDAAAVGVAGVAAGEVAAAAAGAATGEALIGAGVLVGEAAVVGAVAGEAAIAGAGAAAGEAAVVGTAAAAGEAAATTGGAGQIAGAGGVPAAAAALPRVAEFWDRGRAVVGDAVEKILGGNLGGCRVIDKFANGVATSIKSIDLRAITYQDPKYLVGRIEGYIDKVASFNGIRWGTIAIDESQVIIRELEIAIPPVQNAMQSQVMEAMVQSGAASGVGVKFIVLP
jgi:RsiW-degrading membrane proteinase PrsW (M82 family)